MGACPGIALLEIWYFFQLYFQNRDIFLYTGQDPILQKTIINNYLRNQVLHPTYAGLYQEPQKVDQYTNLSKKAFHVIPRSEATRNLSYLKYCKNKISRFARNDKFVLMLYVLNDFW